jgi:hypothetical protein
MHFGQGRGEIAITLIGDDDGAAGLGDEEVGAGDADIGSEKLRPQRRPRFGEQRGRLIEIAILRQVL